MSSSHVCEFRNAKVVILSLDGGWKTKENVERKKDFWTFLYDCNCSNIKNREWISRCLGLVLSVERKRERNGEEKRARKNKFTVWCCPWKMVLPNIFIRLEIILLPRKIHNFIRRKKREKSFVANKFPRHFFLFFYFALAISESFWPGFRLHLL